MEKKNQNRETWCGYRPSVMPAKKKNKKHERKEGKQIYFWYTYRQERYPAAWTVKVGTGKLVYIAPGHNEAVCGHSMIQRMYDNALAYLQV